MQYKSGITPALFEAMKAMGKHIEIIAGSQGLAPAQLGAIKKLSISDGMTTTELGSRLGINASTVTALVDRMERDGFVRRERNDRDRRVVQVWLTGYAKKIARELPDVDKYMTSLALKEFSQAELNLLVEWLIRFQELLERESPERE